MRPITAALVGVAVSAGLLLAGPALALGAAEGVPSEAIVCEGDSCQPLPPEPDDPTPGTLVPGPGNPAVHFIDEGSRRHRRHARGHQRQKGGHRKSDAKKHRRGQP